MKRVLSFIFFSFVILFLSGCDMLKDYDSQTKLHEIVPTTSFSQDGKLVINAKNDTGVAVKMTFGITFYDKNKKLIESKQEVLEVVRADDEINIGVIPPKDFLTYKVTLDVSRAQKNYDILFKIEDRDEKKKVVLNFSNNNSFIIDYLNISVAYYYKNELVGLTNNIVKNVEANKTTEIVVDHPTFANGKSLLYDTYKVFINDLYYEAK